MENLFFQLLLGVLLLEELGDCRYGQLRGGSQREEKKIGT